MLDYYQPLKQILTIDKSEDKVEKLVEFFNAGKLTLPLLLLQDQYHSNQTPLFWLSVAAQRDQHEVFEKLLKQFPNIPLQAFLAQVPHGAYKNKSVLWMLSRASVKCPNLFLSVWASHHLDITLKDLLTEAAQNNNKGRSILFWLALATYYGHIEPFMLVWQKHHEDLPLSLLLAKVKDAQDEGPDIDNGISIMGLLVAAAGNGHPEPLAAAAEKFKDVITLPNIVNEAQIGQDSQKKFLLVAYQRCISTIENENETPFSRLKNQK